MAKKKLAFESWAEVNDAMKEVAELRGQVKELEVEMNTAMALSKKKADELAQPLLERAKELEKDIKAYATHNKAGLIGKTKQLTFGSVGFRRSTTLVIQDEESCINMLRKLGLEDCMIIKESVNRDVLKTKPSDVIMATGAYLQPKDNYKLTVDEEKLRATG